MGVFGYAGRCDISVHREGKKLGGNMTIQCDRCELVEMCKYVETMRTLATMKLPPGIGISGGCNYYEEEEIEIVG